MARPVTLSFVTYTMVSNVPNGINNFKFRITNPMGETMHETKINAVDVKNNAFSNILIWKNVNFKVHGEHTITFYMATNTGFEPMGSTVIIIAEPPDNNP